MRGWLSLKRNSPQLERFFNSQDIARFDENASKFRFPLFRMYSRFRKTLYDYSCQKMKSENNQSLMTLYCPNLARSIFIVEKAWQRKQSNRFWVDNSQGVSESESSLNMMILILVEAIITDNTTAIHQPEHWSLQGFTGSPFPNDSDHNTRHSVTWATEGRNPNMAAVDLACGSNGKQTFTQEICKEAKIVAKVRNSTFLSGNERKLKSREQAIKRRNGGQSPPPDVPMFWT